MNPVLDRFADRLASDPDLVETMKAVTPEGQDYPNLEGMAAAHPDPVSVWLISATAHRIYASMIVDGDELAPRWPHDSEVDVFDFLYGPILRSREGGPSRPGEILAKLPIDLHRIAAAIAGAHIPDGWRLSFNVDGVKVFSLAEPAVETLIRPLGDLCSWAILAQTGRRAVFNAAAGQVFPDFQSSLYAVVAAAGERRRPLSPRKVVDA